MDTTSALTDKAEVNSKHVTFELSNSSLNQTSNSNHNYPQPDSLEAKAKDSSSVDVSRQQAKPGRYKKGLNASFLRTNPRYINEPICHVLPNETSSSVQDCLQWETARNDDPQRKITHSLDSTSRVDYQPLPSNQRPPPLKKHLLPQRIHGIAPLTNGPKNGTQSAKVKEKISYRHQYNCRTDPNEPVRGKLHGSFVWRPA